VITIFSPVTLPGINCMSNKKSVEIKNKIFFIIKRQFI
jgi:hypothetical protein